MTTRRTMLLASVGVAATLLAGCGADGATKNPGTERSGETSTSSKAPAENTGGFPFKKGQVDTKDFVEKATAAQKATKSGKVEMENTDGKNTMEATTEFEIIDGVERSHTVVKVSGQTSETISIGDKNYTKTGDKWQESQGITIGSNNADSMSTFAKAMESASYAGKDEHGHRFDVVADLSKAGGSSSSASPQKLPATLWFDDEMRMVRGTYEIESQGTKVSSVTTRGSFNEKFGIEAPKVG